MVAHSGFYTRSFRIAIGACADKSTASCRREGGPGPARAGGLDGLGSSVALGSGPN